MTTEPNPRDGVLRRTVLKASAVMGGVLGMSTIVNASGRDEDKQKEDDPADETDVDDNDDEQREVDEPVGFGGEMLAPYAPFPDNMNVTFTLTFAEDHEGDPITVELDDASTTAFLEARWEPGGTAGWHTHPGPVIVNIVEGELELVWERDCVPRTYNAGETFFDAGDEIHTATNPSDTEEALAYAIFLGVPDGATLTENVEPVDC
ncbi:cupin domain-containing protein [Natrialbaceae archaeon A-gly3]